jgi:tRNA-splicing ligase RtcB
MTERSYKFIESNGVPIKAWIKGVPVEEQAIEQLRKTASMPFVKGVAVMPDCHVGKGSTVGSVVATKSAIVPSMVGVDIGCGMMAQRTNLTASDLPDSLSALRSEIERRIPHGRTNNGGPGDRGAWHDLPAEATKAFNHFEFDQSSERSLSWRIAQMFDKHPKLKGQWNGERIASHMGTLGTGNHFVEVCLDEEQRVWVMLHSGSRGIGNRIGSYFIEKAKEDMRRWFINLPDTDLSYIPEGSDLFKDYCDAVKWAQEYASVNRRLMMGAALGALYKEVPKDFICDCAAVNCHHNYISWENHYGENMIVTRKGAVRAREGDLGIIPGSMGARSFIVRGKGNPESFCSCSHGAGRKMSRGAAKKTFTLDDHVKATEGIECRKDADVIDETPGAYKDIEDVMAAQSDLVEVVHTLRQVLCVKG